MTLKNYQRKHLRAPLRGPVLYTDGDFVLKASAVNLSEGGLLIDQLPRFPQEDELGVVLALPQFPIFKNFTLLKLQTFSKELFGRKVIRFLAKMARREQLAKNLDHIFHCRVALQFMQISLSDQKLLENYVSTYASNLIYLQTLIDTFHCDEETKLKTRLLASILGHQDIDRIALLRASVAQDYKGLQWS